MLRTLLLASTALVAMPTDAHGGPLIAAGLLAAIPTLSAGFAQAAGAVIAAALAVGASLLLSPRPNVPKPQDVSGLVKQDVPPRWVHYGRRRVGGALLFAETENGNLHLLIANQQGIVDGRERIFLDDREVYLDGDGFVDGLVDGGENPIPDRLIQILSRDGSEDQSAIDALITFFPDLWSSEHRARGIGLSYLRAGAVEAESFSKIYPNRIPTLIRIDRFSRPYDPRSDSEAWTQNLALQCAAYLASPDGMQIPFSYLKVARLTAAANLCDEGLSTKDGSTIARYHGGLSYQLDADPASVVSRFMTAMDGRLTLLPDATIAIDAGAWTEPTVILDDSCIIAYELRAGGDPASEANEVVVKYSFADADYAEASSDPWRNDDDISASGQIKSLLIEAYEIEEHNHGRRIAKLTARRTLPAYQGSITTNLAGLQAWDQRFIRVRGTLFSLDHTFEVLGIAFDTEAKTVTLQVVAMDASAYAFDPETEEGTAPTIPDDAAVSEIHVPDGVTATRSSRPVSLSVSIPVIEVEWDAPSRFYSAAEAQISVHGADRWYDIALNRDTSPPTSAIAENVANNTTYDIRVRWRGPGSDWSDIVTVTAVADPTPPDEPTEVDAAPAGTGEADVTWRPPSSSNYAGVHLYGSTVNDILAADLLATVPGSPSPLLQGRRLTGLAAGTWYFWVAAINGSGVESDAVPTGATTVS